LYGRESVRVNDVFVDFYDAYTDASEVAEDTYDEFGNLERVVLPDGRVVRYPTDPNHRRIGRVFEDGQEAPARAMEYGEGGLRASNCGSPLASRAPVRSYRLVTLPSHDVLSPGLTLR
jgi:YD repeat-containing protein